MQIVTWFCSIKYSLGKATEQVNFKNSCSKQQKITHLCNYTYIYLI
jgi:hypothetical protein